MLQQSLTNHIPATVLTRLISAAVLTNCIPACNSPDKKYHCYCSRHGFTYTRGWMQMVLAPNDLFSWNNNTMKYNFYNGYVTLMPTDAQWHLLCAWSFLEAVVEPSSSFSAISLCLLSSPVWTQLIVPHWGPRAPTPKMPSPLIGSTHTPFPGSRTVMVLKKHILQQSWQGISLQQSWQVISLQQSWQVISL